MIYVGIDWADDHHDIVITDDSAKTLDQFRIDHTCDGFALLHSHLANHQTSPGLVLIAIETSRGLLVHELLQKATPSMPSIQRQSTVTKTDTYFQKQNLTFLMHRHLLISCALTATCFNPSNPFPKTTDFSTGFAVTSVKWLMKNQELPTRLSPA